MSVRGLAGSSRYLTAHLCPDDGGVQVEYFTYVTVIICIAPKTHSPCCADLSALEVGLGYIDIAVSLTVLVVSWAVSVVSYTNWT